MKKFYALTDAIMNPSLLFQKYVKYQIFSSRILEHRRDGGITKFLVVGDCSFWGWQWDVMDTSLGSARFWSGTPLRSFHPENGHYNSTYLVDLCDD